LEVCYCFEGRGTKKIKGNYWTQKKVCMPKNMQTFRIQDPLLVIHYPIPRELIKWQIFGRSSGLRINLRAPSQS